MSTNTNSDVSTELPKYMQQKNLSIRDTWNAYRAKVRSGDMGSLPAVIGLIILVILFHWLTRFSSRRLTLQTFSLRPLLL